PSRDRERSDFKISRIGDRNLVPLRAIEQQSLAKPPWLRSRALNGSRMLSGTVASFRIIVFELPVRDRQWYARNDDGCRCRLRPRLNESDQVRDFIRMARVQ